MTAVQQHSLSEPRTRRTLFVSIYGGREHQGLIRADQIVDDVLVTSEAVFHHRYPYDYTHRGESVSDWYFFTAVLHTKSMLQ